MKLWPILITLLLLFGCTSPTDTTLPLSISKNGTLSKVSVNSRDNSRLSPIPAGFQILQYEAHFFYVTTPDIRDHRELLYVDGAWNYTLNSANGVYRTTVRTLYYQKIMVVGYGGTIVERLRIISPDDAQVDCSFYMKCDYPW